MGNPEIQAINCSSMPLATFEHRKKDDLRLSQKELFPMLPNPCFVKHLSSLQNRLCDQHIDPGLELLFPYHFLN